MSGVPWTETTPGSSSKLNLMTAVSGSGAELAALDKTKHRLVICTSTGSGFTLDHVYLFDNSGTTAIDLSSITDHTHTATAGTGGDIVGVFAWNNSVCDLWLTKTDDVKKAQWIETVTSTGTIEDNTDGTTGERATRLRTNGTSGATATISYPHLKLSFSKYCFFQTKLRMETFSSIAVHSGVGADDTSAADSNTRKFQAEICTVTNNNWWLRTASGSANSASDTGIVATADRVRIDIEHVPTGTPTDHMYVGGTLFSKTTNIAIDSTTTDNNIIKHSVKNSTAADRPLLVYGSRLMYRISDTWGH